MSAMAARHRRLLADLVPMSAALLVIVFYFLTVVPNSRPYWGKYLLVSLVLVVVSRIPTMWYLRTQLTPPVQAYVRGRREGRSFSRSELGGFYKAFVAYVPKSQIFAFWVWCSAVLAMALVTYAWIQRSWVSVIGILFSGMIATTIHLAFSYFMMKREIRPLIEEVGAALESPPDVSAYRVSLRNKLLLSIMGFATLSFAAFGVMLYTRLSLALSELSIRAGSAQAQQVAAQLKTTPSDGWQALLLQTAHPLYTLLVLDGDGTPVKDLASGPFSAGSLEGLLGGGRKVVDGQRFVTLNGTVQFFPVDEGHYLVLVTNPESVHSIMRHTITFGAVFLVITLLIFGLYLLWLSRDIGQTLDRTAECERRLAAGDLTRVPSIWSDDELGTMADHLRKTFQNLGRMTHEVVKASTTVDNEVTKTLETTDGLRGQVGSQAYFAERTTQSVKVMDEGMVQVFKAMEQVAGATQEVSSAILQMQASVEEIARNSDVLIQSVEKTVQSSSEISRSTTGVKVSTDQLHSSAQEAVSFLMEQDAALEETRRNAGALSESASRVTSDAEGGFSSVAAVEEEIRRTQSAGEQSRATLVDLLSSIEKIGRIVDVIQDVTEQTNLLSLNASIIAAGAGEHGKPFAVVATQIRELSARTAGNAKEIRTVIRSLTRSGEEMAASMDKTFQVVSRSADLSYTAAEALRTILESASSQEEMCKRIASATSELAQGGVSANRAMHRVFEMIEGIAGAVQEVAASTRLLNDEGERVREVANQLKNATDEQARGTRVIGEAVRHIMEDSRQVTHSIQTQTTESGAIYDSMKQVAETAQAIEEAFSDLIEAATHLQRSASSLRQEIRAFKSA